jgi:aminopeptidase
MPIDQRAVELAKIAVNYSINVKPKEKIIISGGLESVPFLKELYKEIILKGGYPIVKVGLPDVSDFFYKNAKPYQIKFFPQYWFDTVKQADGYIGVDTEENTQLLKSADPKLLTERTKITKPISDYIVNSKPDIRRVTIAYPCQSHAQEAGMSLNEWEKYVYSSCLIDWEKFSKKLEKINKRFEKGKKVELKGKNVDLKFSIENKNSVADKGEENMPGGEIFMAPQRESLEGEIKFDYPRIYMGRRISGVYLKFKKGKVIEFNADEGPSFLKEILNIDRNSSYVGEFGIGMKPNINKYTNNLLFDEKIAGTIHLALGMAYKQNGGGNDSAIHLDIVKDMKKGKIILDGKTVQDKGEWEI